MKSFASKTYTFFLKKVYHSKTDKTKRNVLEYSYWKRLEKIRFTNVLISCEEELATI